MSRLIQPRGSVNLSDSEKNILNNRIAGKLIFTEYQGKSCVVLYKESRILSVLFIDESKIGNIYKAKVKKVAKNIEAYFVEISNKEICFLPFKEANSSYVLNRQTDARILEGDEIAVQVIRDAQKTKQATVTTNIKPKTNESLTEYLKKAVHKSVFCCLDKNNVNIAQQINSYIKPNEYDEIIIDNLPQYININTELTDIFSNKKITIYKDTFPLDKIYSLSAKIEEALGARIWLKSGGYLIVQHTEALTVIDVNSGKYEAKKGNVDETALKINLEAAKEIAIQLRLRNLSGIIIVDFINFSEEESRNILISEMKKYVEEDPVKTKIVDITPLGLMEITRKKASKPIAEYFHTYEKL